MQGWNKVSASLLLLVLTVTLISTSNAVAAGAPLSVDSQGSLSAVLTSDEAIASMNDAKLSTLARELVSGRPVVVIGSGNELRRIFGIPYQGPDYDSAFLDENVVTTAVRNDSVTSVEATTARRSLSSLSKYYGLKIEPMTGNVYEYYGSAPKEHSDKGLQSVLTWTHDLLRSAKQQSTKNGAPQAYRVGSTEGWTYLGYTDWDIYFSGQISIHTKFERYRLNENDASKNVYRIDATTQTGILSFVHEIGRCGFFVDHRSLSIDGDYYNDGYHNTKLYTYGPTTTIGSSTTGFSISINTAGVTGLTYAASWSSPDVSTVDQSIYLPDNLAKWTEYFKGPTYGIPWILVFWPLYADPCAAATASYQSYQTAVFEASASYGAKIRVQRQTVWNDDYITGIPFLLYILSRYQYAYTVSGDLYFDYVASPGGGGGCPNLLVWNGGEFVDQGVLNIHNYEDPQEDVNCYQRLTTTPSQSDEGYYTLKLSEIADGYTFSHSFLDRLKLYVVGNDGHWRQCTLVSATHSAEGDVKRELLRSDDVYAETYKGEEITLLFQSAGLGEGAWFFIFMLEGHNPMKV